MSRKEEATQQAAARRSPIRSKNRSGFGRKRARSRRRLLLRSLHAGDRCRIVKDATMHEGVLERAKGALREQEEEAQREAAKQQGTDDDAKELIS